MAGKSWSVKLLRNKGKIVVTEKDLFNFCGAEGFGDGEAVGPQVEEIAR
jgi:hypothetical protein